MATLVSALGVVVLLAINGVLGAPGVSAAVIAASVSRDPAQMRAAFTLPAARSHGRALHWQANGSFCGPASLVNVFRSLGEHNPVVRYVINFSRRPIFGGGSGHHSPVGGYLEAQDLVLVLDVNHDYSPWLIERERLFAAMDTFDGDKKRGLLRIARK
jgi:hypothetical protein